jgi:hypothetical protein
MLHENYTESQEFHHLLYQFGEGRLFPKIRKPQNQKFLDEQRKLKIEHNLKLKDLRSTSLCFQDLLSAIDVL